MKLRDREIEITNEEFDRLLAAGFTHVAVPDSSTPDRVAYVALPKALIGGFYTRDRRQYDLGWPDGLPEEFKAVWIDGDELPSFDEGYGFIPSYAAAPGYIFLPDGSPAPFKTIPKAVKSPYRCPFCGSPDCTGECQE